MSKEQPLIVEVVDDELVIRIGIGTLAFSIEEASENNPWDDTSGNYKKLYVVTDPLEFAMDVRDELIDEEEDGSSLLNALLDKTGFAAIYNGSLGADRIDDIEEE